MALSVQGPFVELAGDLVEFDSAGGTLTADRQYGACSVIEVVRLPNHRPGALRLFLFPRLGSHRAVVRLLELRGLFKDGILQRLVLLEVSRPRSLPVRVQKDVELYHLVCEVRQGAEVAE